MNKYNNFGILRAYAVPHPPIILPEIGKGRETEISETVNSLQEVAKEIADLQPDTIILSTPHAPLYSDAFFLSVSEKDSGDMRDFGYPQVGESLFNDLELAQLIIEKARQQDISLAAEPGEVNYLDHGSLVPLRFICAEYSNFKFLRLGLSALSGETHYRLGQLIQESVNQLGRKVVFIASGDLSHVLKEDGPYGYRPEGPKFDQMVTAILARAAFDELLDMPEKLTEAAAQCGLPSFRIMAGALDGRDVLADLLSYQGNFGVGYAVLKFEPGGDNPKRSFLNSETEVNPYVSLARKTIEDYIGSGQIAQLNSDLPQEMTGIRAGAFVSLHKDGKLRGCIGTLEPYADSLAAEIQNNAISAATTDPRFPPLRKEELADLEVSVDVLSPPEKIEDVADLDPRRYGLIVSKGSRRGVLLPNLEGIDTVEEQVRIALTKAGIPYKDEDYQLERFEVVRYE